jgi:hypothetical protein
MTIRQIDLNSWEEFEPQIDTIQNNLSSMKSKDTTYFSDFLYRGQSNSEWRLTTTLDRYSESPYNAYDYYKKILAAKPRIEAHTERKWDIISTTDYYDWLSKQAVFGMLGMEAYDYMVHLRHFGFPSPLLDWTRSPYVAAFFAFSDCDPNKTERVSIYIFIEYVGHGKTGRAGETRVFSHGPHVRSHKRHFLQQSEYTICTQKVEESWVYAPHESGLQNSNTLEDMMWKLTIPASERFKVLRSLDRYNLNAFSLFGSEESLMQTVALREFVFRR